MEISLLGCFFVGGMIWVVVCLLMLFRNEWLARRRIWCIIHLPELYYRLLSYDECMHRFWIWDIRKLVRK